MAREYWFCFFTPTQFAGEEKLTPEAARERTQFLAESYEAPVECYRGKSERLDGSESPFATA